MSPEQKQWIDSATYEELLRYWRSAPAGNLMFRGDTGDYYAARLKQMREEDPGVAVQASKNIGWKRSHPSGGGQAPPSENRLTAADGAPPDSLSILPMRDTRCR